MFIEILFPGLREISKTGALRGLQTRGLIKRMSDSQKCNKLMNAFDVTIFFKFFNFYKATPTFANKETIYLFRTSKIYLLEHIYNDVYLEKTVLQLYPQRV